MIQSATPKRLILVRNPPLPRLECGRPARRLRGRDRSHACSKASAASTPRSRAAPPTSRAASWRRLRRAPGQLRDAAPGSGSHHARVGHVLLVPEHSVPPFDDARARQAVSYALDRAEVVRIAGGPEAAQPTCQLLPPNFPGYRPYCPFTAERERRRRVVWSRSREGARARSTRAGPPARASPSGASGPEPTARTTSRARCSRSSATASP